MPFSAGGSEIRPYRSFALPDRTQFSHLACLSQQAVEIEWASEHDQSPVR